MHRTPLQITALNILSRFMHFLFFLAVGNLYGANSTTDSVFFAQAPLVVIISMVTTVAEVIVMPALHRAKNVDAMRPLTVYLLKRGLILVLCITLPSLVLTKLYLGDVSGWVFVILAPMPLLSVYSAVNIGMLNTEGYFNKAALAPVGGALSALTVVVLAPRSTVFLAFAFLAFEMGRAAGVRLAISFVPDSTKSNPRAVIAIESLKKWSREKTKHQIVASLLISLVPFVDILFASRFQASSVTLIELATKLWNVVPLVLSGHTLLFYAYVSREASVNAMRGSEVNVMALRMALVAFFMSVILVLLSGPIVDLLYGYGSIEVAQRRSLAVIFNCYVFGAAPFVVSVIYGRALSAEGRNIILVKFSIVVLLFNVLLNILFIRIFGLKGIAISTSVCGLIGSLLLCYWSGYLRRG